MHLISCHGLTSQLQQLQAAGRAVAVTTTGAFTKSAVVLRQGGLHVACGCKRVRAREDNADDDE
jgi:hypothetical protein